MEQLLHDDKTVRAGLSENFNCPDDLLHKLSLDPDWEVRHAIAGRIDCPPSILSLLVSDDIREVREAVAGNKQCPEGVLTALINDLAKEVRWALACNSACTSDILNKLNSDYDHKVREGVTTNPNLPLLPLLKMATRDSSTDVRISGQRVLRSKGPSVWTGFVKDGFSLSTPMGKTTRSTTLGDALLRVGLSDVYQLIQGVVLELSIQQADTTSNMGLRPLSARSSKMRL
ncbi:MULTISPECIES: hypothetical protein [Aeromonas]|uniref:hypothetical protein n=1 Tax=Aeromonas TaxID=642 RepID=UPI002B06215E|nr:hypothetical protein [Aeromonas jandaei]